MNALQVFNELKLHTNKCNKKWYARHPSLPSLLFFKGSKTKEYCAGVMKDKQVRKIIQATLGLDLLASNEWEIVKIITDKRNNVMRVKVIDVDS